MSPPRGARLVRLAFLVYALVLLTATHWPGVTIEGSVPRPDLLIHAVAYALLAGMLAATGWCGRPGSWGSATIAWGASLAFATLDELTQPLFARSADATDWLADAAGAAVGVLVAVGIARLAGGRGAGA